MRRTILLLFSSIALNTFTFAQEIGSIAARWDGDPSEWVIYSDSLYDNEMGTIEKRWENRIDIWDYSIGDTSGIISMKWKGNANFWEITGPNIRIQAQTTWSGDFSNWLVFDHQGTIRFQSRFNDSLEDWETEDAEEYGYFAIWTEEEGDIGHWLVYDHLNPQKTTIQTKILLGFLPIWINLYKE